MHCVSWAFFCGAVGKIEGAIIKSVTEAYDASTIGTEISIDNISFNPFTAALKIHGMVVANPAANPKYDSEYLFKAHVMKLDINMWQLIKSRMRRIEVEVLTLHAVTINYDQPRTLSGKSNLRDVINFMEGSQPTQVPESEAARTLQTKEENQPVAEMEPLKGQQETEMVVRKLSFRDVGATAIIGGHALQIVLPEIESDDFEKECSGTSAHYVIMAVLYKLEAAVAESVSLFALAYSRMSPCSSARSRA